MTGVVPPWLSAQRGDQPPNQDEQAATPTQAPAAPVAPALSALAPEPVTLHPFSRGFAEPQAWPFDGCARREPVLDHDFNPPRTVRRVGWHRCMRCRRPFFSEDVVRLRLCGGDAGGCRGGEDRYAQGETGGS